MAISTEEGAVRFQNTKHKLYFKNGKWVLLSKPGNTKQILSIELMVSIHGIIQNELKLK